MSFFGPDWPTQLAQRLRDITDDVRVIALSLDETAALTGEYLQRFGVGWRLARSADERSLTMRTHSPTTSSLRLFLTRSPEIIVWRASETTTGTTIRTSFHLTWRSWFWRYFFVCAPLPFFPVILEAPLSPVLGKIGHFLLSLAPLLASLIAALLILSKRKHITFVEGFYRHLSHKTGVDATVLTAGPAHPDVLVLGLIILVVFCLKSPSLFANGRWPEQLLSYGLIALVPLCVALVTILLLKPDALKPEGRGEIGIHFVLAMPVVIYSAWTLLLLSTWNVMPHNPIVFLLLHLPVTVVVCYIVTTVLATCLAYDLWFHVGRPPPSQTLGAAKSSIVFVLLIGAVWGVLACFNLAGVSFALVAIEYSVLGVNRVLTNSFTSTLASLDGQLLVRAILGVYAMPIVLVLSLFLFQWFGELLTMRRITRSQPASDDLLRRVRRVAMYADVREPLVLVEPSPLILGSASQRAGFGPVLKISTGAFATLTNDELEALVAHELWHLKKHGRLFFALSVLSRLTLFGGTFLSFILDTKQLEYQADAFAFRYLAQKPNPAAKAIMISTLEKIVTTSSLSRHLATSRSLVSLAAGGLTTPDMPLGLSQRLRFLYELYFGDLAALYMHPSLDERIKAIEAMP